MEKRLQVGTQAIIAAIAIAMILTGCVTQNGAARDLAPPEAFAFAGEDPALNGEWFRISSFWWGDAEIVFEEEFVFENGAWEGRTDGYPEVRGIYTARGGEITLRITHVSANMFHEFGVAPGWHSREDLAAFFAGLGAPEDFLREISQMFYPFEETYSVTGDTLTLTFHGDTLALTRR